MKSEILVDQAAACALAPRISPRTGITHHLSGLPSGRTWRGPLVPAAQARAIVPSGQGRSGQAGAGSARLPVAAGGWRDALASKMSMSRAVRMSALGSSLRVVYERWHEWAVRQRDFISNGRPGITAEESDTVARRFGVLGIRRNDLDGEGSDLPNRR
jgi:hypothetical protein